MGQRLLEISLNSEVLAMEDKISIVVEVRGLLKDQGILRSLRATWKARSARGILLNVRS